MYVWMFCGDGEVICVTIELDYWRARGEVVEEKVEESWRKYRSLGDTVREVYCSGCLAFDFYLCGSASKEVGKPSFVIVLHCGV